MRVQLQLKTGDTSTKGQGDFVAVRASNEEFFHSRRHRVTISRFVSIPPLNWSVWTRVCEVWAEIVDDETLIIRFQADLMPGQRLTIGRNHFQIVGVIDLPQAGRHRLTKLKIRASADLPDAQW